MQARTRGILQQREDEMARARRAALWQRRVYRATVEQREATERMARECSRSRNEIKGL